MQCDLTRSLALETRGDVVDVCGTTGRVQLAERVHKGVLAGDQVVILDLDARNGGQGSVGPQQSVKHQQLRVHLAN